MAILPEPMFDPMKLPDILRRFKGKIKFKRYKSGSFFLCKPDADIRETLQMIRKFAEALAG